MLLWRGLGLIWLARHPEGYAMRLQLPLTLAALAVTLLAAPLARATDIYVLTNSAIGYNALETGFGRID